MPASTSTQRIRTSKFVAVALVMAALLSGCASSASADASAPRVDHTQNVCSALVDQDPPLDGAIDLYVAYSTNRQAVTQQEVEDAIAYLDSLKQGTSGQALSGLVAMTSVLHDIRDRYISGNATEPAVDLQAFLDGVDQVRSVC